MYTQESAMIVIVRRGWCRSNEQLVLHLADGFLFRPYDSQLCWAVAN